MIALVQRPRRKRHLATTSAGATTWETLGSCRLSIQADGAEVASLSAAGSVGTWTAQDDDVCLHCLHLIAFAHLLEARPELLTSSGLRHLEAVAS